MASDFERSEKSSPFPHLNPVIPSEARNLLFFAKHLTSDEARKLLPTKHLTSGEAKNLLLELRKCKVPRFARNDEGKGWKEGEDFSLRSKLK